MTAAFSWTNIQDKSGKQIEHRTGTWDGFVTQLRTAKKYNSKAECPWIKLAVFGDHRGPGGSLRNNANVLAVTGIEADYDGEQLAIPAAIELLAAAGIRAAIYPSASNTPDKPRWRVLCPLAEPQAPEDRQLFVARLNGVLGGVIADESFTLSQSYYYGNVGTNSYKVHTTEGACLDQLPALDAAALYKAKSRTPPRPATQHEAVESVPDSTLEDLRSALAAVSADDRTEWISMGMRLKTLGDVGFGLWDMWARTSADKYDPDDAEYRWDSFEPSSTGYKAVFTAAQAAGWSNPGPAAASTDDFDVVQEDETFTDREQMPKVNPYQVVAREQFLDAPPAKWLIKHVLQEDPGGVAVIYGASGSGKSFMALDMAAAILQGQPWRGRKTHQGAVIYVCAEGAGGFRNRLRAYEQQHGATLPIGVIPNAPNMLDASHVKLMLAAVAEFGPAVLIIFDTLAQVTPGGDENASATMTMAVNNCRRVAKAIGATCMLVHHSGKDIEKGARGHSSLKAAVDTELCVQRAEEGPARAVKVTKQKELYDGEEFGFELDVIVLGQDDDGDDVSSCVVRHTSGTLAEIKKADSGSGKIQRAVLNCVDNMVGLGGDEPEFGALVEAVFAQLDGKSRRTGIRNAVTDMVNAKILHLNCNHVGRVSA